MNILILAQEEPLFFTPLVTGLIKTSPSIFSGVIIVGSRTLNKKTPTLSFFWLLLGPFGFVAFLASYIFFYFLKITRLYGTKLDSSSIAGVARKYAVKVHTCRTDEHSLHALLSSLQPDLVLNQSDLILSSRLLSLSRLGFLNRHGARLPQYKGRLASLRAHMAEHPSYVISMHLLDTGIDTGPLVLLYPFDCRETSEYYRVLKKMQKASIQAVLLAIQKLERGESPQPQPGNSIPPFPYPTIEELHCYRSILKKRKKGRP